MCAVYRCTNADELRKVISDFERYVDIKRGH